ncbi:ribosome recycling factor [bacterium]|nr:ribosome recycling factor [bacterium]
MEANAMQNLEERMKKTIESTRRTLSTIRTGRATPDLLSRITVDYYGSMVPISQVANISVVEGNILLINVFDANAIENVERAIMKSDLGVTPQRDGIVIRLILPDLTAERRQELAKIVKKQGEESKISLRNIRQDFLNEKKKDDSVTDDDVKHFTGKAQEIIDKYNREVEEVIKDKEKEILSV